MTLITRDNIRLPLRINEPGGEGPVWKTYTGTLAWDAEHRILMLVDPSSFEIILGLTDGRREKLGSNETRISDVPYRERRQGIHPEHAGVYDALSTLGVIIGFPQTTDARTCVVEVVRDLGVATQEASTRTASVTLFKDNGRYYTGEAWRVPVKATGPKHMELSPDFRRIDGGAVLVDAYAAEETPEALNWGIPHLFPSEAE